MHKFQTDWNYREIIETIMAAKQDSRMFDSLEAANANHNHDGNGNGNGNQNPNPSNGQTLQPLGRQSSIYSLTLDEFQHTLSENGKNFGSMNMDEFLNSIWTAEENQNQNQNPNQNTAAAIATVSAAQFPNTAASPNKGIIAKQPSLQGQGSLTIPEPLCRKTVDEVWSEIHKNQLTNNGGSHCQVQNNPNVAQKQATFGEMTLEDFLVRAGIVREQHFGLPPAPPPPMGMYQNSSHPAMVPGPSLVIPRPVIAMGSNAGGVSNLGTYHQPLRQNGVGEASGCVIGMKGGVGYGQPPPVVTYEGRVGSGVGGGFGQVTGLGIGSPVSPVPSEGLSANQDNANQFGLDMNPGARKRIIDGPVEKVVERRQRRMIKNRESAARSRARKQAYTVELEAELNQLREENAHLKQTLVELERKRKQQLQYEEARARKQKQTKAYRMNETLQSIRRSMSCPY
ncbi:protein ABSCISIC ACID-INSENSITIVE 5-like isoform X2 [Andrographis paniculata]|uniref:protein ABSCISIC ACID-INSENSITIVE 5-like isoform X2 n=1 Tax=Andrographis paniculata TaxID=175694 RepID=UPI0021E87CCF|nr:protein ABSCISIC ACID-INSENSITIVE 5-like isoform X2 [Andrographis paniculata]XP_051149166.1 protein ABSCISIC ACID-INSENSITIVE 5-like isoform X2 [Andrographis paniculata]